MKAKRNNGSVAVLVICCLVVVNGIGFMAYRHLKGESTANAASAKVMETKTNAADNLAKVAKLRKAAMADIINGEWSAAIQGLERALALNPGDEALQSLLDRAKKELEKSAADGAESDQESSEDESTEVAAKRRN